MEAPPPPSPSPSPPPQPALDDCLKLLRGDRDEQKLAGLLLAAKFCHGDDTASIRMVYDAVGTRFLDRLLMTGMGRGSAGVKSEEDREVYLRLAVTVLAAFCRVPEIASSEEMVSKVPVVTEIISKSTDQSIFEEGYEYLLSVAVASGNGRTMFYQPEILDFLAPHISALDDGSRSLEHAIRLLQLIMDKLPMDMLNAKNLPGLACMVVSIARQFAVLHNAFKFDALHLLTAILSSNKPINDALRSMSSKTWAAYIRVGIAEILQNRVVSAEKLQALLLGESVMSIIGENWLLEQSKLPGVQETLPIDKFFLLVLESSRVEVAVVLNELAYLKYEASKSSSVTAETIRSKQRDLAVSFSVIEKIIKVTSNVCGMEGHHLKESTLTKVIGGLNETTNLVLDYLQDSKAHGQKRGDDLLAAVRITGRYLAETPYACKDKTRDLLEYMLSVEGEDESSAFYSVCFLLPMLCQITMEIDGCKALVSFEGHKAVMDCLVKMIKLKDMMVEDDDATFLACDTILNVLLKRNDLQAHLRGSDFIHLMHALTLWAERTNDPSSVMMASCICVLALDLFSEDSRLKQYNFEHSTVQSLAKLIARSLNQGQIRDDMREHSDLHHIITKGYNHWAKRFPSVRDAVERALHSEKLSCMNLSG